MRISILVTADSATKIQHLLSVQPLATQASVAREAFELGLRTLTAEAEQPEEEPDLVKLDQAHADTVDTGKTEPATEPRQPASAPEPHWPPLELLVEGDEDEDAELAQLFDSL